MPRKSTTAESSPTVWLASSPNFSGGQDTATDPRDLEKEKFTLLENGYVARSNRAVKRPGFADFTDAPFAGPVRNMYRFKTSDGTINTTLAWSEHDLHALDASGAVRLLARTAFEDGNITFCQYGDTVYMSDGVWCGLCAVKQAAAAQKAQVLVTAAADDWTDVTYNITGTVDVAGAAGNDYTITIVNPGTASHALTVAMTVKDIVVTLATDVDSVVTSTALEVVTALNADAGIGAVITWDPATEDIMVARSEVGFYNGTDIGGIYFTTTAITFNFTHLCTRGGNRIFGVDAADPATVRWCTVNTPETWPDENQIRPDKEVTGLLEVGAVQLIFMEQSIYRIDGTDPTTWTLTSASANGLGLPSNASNTLMELEGVATYLSDKGLAVYEGSHPRTISDDVKNLENATANLIPLDSGVWDGAFTMVVGDYIWLLYKSVSTVDGCDRAMTYDYRRGLWSGPWTFDSPVTCGACDPTNDGDEALPYLGGYSGAVLRQSAHEDNGVPFRMLFRSKTFDCAREAVDKQVIDLRATYKAAAATTITMRLYREGAVFAAVTTTFTVAAGEGVIQKRVPHVRGRDFYIELESSDDVYVEFSGCEFDYFFVRLR
jgi:hypothetical protein